MRLRISNKARVGTLAAALAWAGCGVDKGALGAGVDADEAGTDAGDADRDTLSGDDAGGRPGPDADVAEDGGRAGGDGGSSSGSSSGQSGAMGSDASGAEGGSDECESDCDDGVTCTVDTCVDETCVHRLDDSACPEGESCDLEAGGCTAGGACGSAEDCSFPVCSQSRGCDASLAVCVYDALDSDGDGYAPVSCGGADCDDDDDEVGPDQVERCNGVDDDCDGQADEGAQCPGEGQVCRDPGTEDAACGCMDADIQCQSFGGPVCVNTATDSEHCGRCNRSCGTAGVCRSGECSCPDSASMCPIPAGPNQPPGSAGTTCVDTQTDVFHCGQCGRVCALGGGGSGGGNGFGGLGLCLDGECASCGGEGEPCCTSGCDGGLTCDGTPGESGSICEPCGGVGERCCTSSGWGGSPFSFCGAFSAGGTASDGPVCNQSGICVN